MSKSPASNKAQSPAPEPIVIPPGYLMDREGRLVPRDRVKQIDLDRDKLVKAVVKKGRKISGELAALRAEVFDEIAAFAEKSAAEYGAKIGGKKGNMTLYSFDGAFMVKISRAENKTFDERLQIAKSLIDECIHDWAKGANKNLQSLVDHAFQTDREGKVSIERVLSLRRLDIDDERWAKAMNAIADSVQVSSTKSYFRIYERIEATGEYRPVALDAANA